MTPAVANFIRRALLPSEILDRRVLEVGSIDVNGSPREVVLPRGPIEYLGIDIVHGPGVDRIAAAEEVTDGDWDIVISCEMLEHVQDWRAVISNLKRITAPGGLMLITTRSQGFPFHAYPVDRWRYEMADMERIFADWKIEMLEADPDQPGVFVRVRKPVMSFADPVDLSAIDLYEMEQP